MPSLSSLFLALLWRQRPLQWNEQQFRCPSDKWKPLILTSTRLAIDLVSTGPTSRPRSATLSYPNPPAGHSWSSLWSHEKAARPSFNTKTWIRRRRAADRDTARKIGCFIDPRIYIFYDNFYLNTIKPYIHPNCLSILFPTRLCWVFYDIVEANYYILSQNPGFVRAWPQVVPPF